MQSWLRRKTSSSGGASPLLGKDKKKEEKELANLTPLERLLHDSGKNEQPVQDDGNDKFFGFENSLYFSEAFREEVINHSGRAPIDTILNGPDGLPRPIVKITPQATQPQNKQKNPASPATARTPTKPEDKSSAEYKKKQALIKGPVIPMDYDNSSNYGMTESLFTSLKDIFEGVIANKARMGVIRPSKLVETLKKEKTEFNTVQHQDAHEFLNLLLNSVIDTVEADAKRREAPAGASSMADALLRNGSAIGSLVGGSTNPLWVHDLFQGTLTSETICLTCEKVSQRDEPFIDLSVDIEQYSSVTACLRQFSEEETLSERNKFSCDNCGYTESQKRMKLKRLPRILALHLKRFKAVESGPGGWSLQKSHHRVAYPFHLRLFNTTDDTDEPDKLYELYAVVVHIGAGPYQGHYVSVVKTRDMGWVLFDDELVEPVKKEFVQNFFGDRPGQASAYVLFYQETTEERVVAEQAREGMTSAMPPRTPGPQTLKSPTFRASGMTIGLGLTSPTTNGAKNFPIPENKAEEEAPSLPDLARAKTAGLDTTPVATPLTAVPPMPGLNHSHTVTADSSMNGAPPIPLSAPPARTKFFDRVRHPSKSGKRPNFLASLDLTKETKYKETNASNEKVNGVPDTSGEETPKPYMNGHHDKAELSALPSHPPPPPTPDASQENEQSQTDQSANTGSSGRKRFLSIRRKAADKANGLRKSSSRANILGFGREEKAQG